MFLYQVLPGNERIVAHGFKRVGNALFSSYASLLGEEIVIEGSSSQTVSSGENSFLQFYLIFSNSLIIHDEKTKEITTVKEVGICDPNYHKIWRSFALIFFKNYQCFEKLYQTLERVFHQISKHFEVG